MTENMIPVFDIFDEKDSIPENYNLLLANLHNLLEDGKIGLSYLTHNDLQAIENSRVERLTGFKNYHFTIKIPYAGRKLSWDIIFDPEDYLLLPDFDFNDDSFLLDPDYDYITKNVPHWEKWDLHDPQSLLTILNEFLELYKRAQIEKLSINNMYLQYKKEYEDLSSSEYLSHDNIEIYVDNHVSFLIEIPVDCSSLPEYIQKEFYKVGYLQNPRGDFAHLSVTILKLDNSSSKVTLQLSPRLDQLLGKVKIPTLRKECSLLEYVATIENILKSRIDFIIDQFHRKRDFVLNMVDMFCSSILEYDTETFSRISFMYEVNDYQCLVTILLGPEFGQEKPKVHLSSVYCQENKECNRTVDNFFFSAIDSVEENINQILKSLKQAVLIFKEHKH